MKNMSNREKTNLVKRILKENFPNNRFKVKSDYSGIDIETDLIKTISSDILEADWRIRMNKSYGEEDYIKSKLKDEIIEENYKNERKIKEILSRYGIKEDISYDQYTGEILQGGNYFIQIFPLRDYKKRR